MPNAGISIPGLIAGRYDFAPETQTLATGSILIYRILSNS